MSACDALLSLARGFRDRDLISQAVKCYEAICGSGTEVPAVEAEVRFELAELLLGHTWNLTEALQHLERANLLLGPVRGSLGLKCRVLSQLGRCRMLIGQGKLALQAYEKAADLAHGAQDTSSSAGQWELHFQLRMAELHAGNRDWTRADASLVAAEQCAAQQGALQHQVVVGLFRTQLLLGLGQYETVGAVISRCTQQLELLAGSGADAILLAQLRLHLLILHALLLMGMCNIAALSKTGSENPRGNPAVVDEMAALLEQAQQAPWAYQWLPAPGIVAVAALLAAAALRPSARFKPTVAHVRQALETLEAELQRRHIGPQATEETVPVQQLAEAAPLLQLMGLLYETAASILLTTTQLAEAQRQLMSLLDLHARFPRTMTPLRHVTHMLAGQYAHCTQHYREALRHFSAVAGGSGACADPMASRVLAAVLMASAELEEGGPDSITRATEALKQQDVFTDVSSRLPDSVRAAALCVSGRVMVAMGDQSAGKLRISRALKMGHSTLQNQQLIVQALNLLAPIQYQAGDVAGMANIFQSSFTFAKNLQDIPSQVAVLTLRSQLLEDVDEQQAAQQYLQRKQGSLDSAVDLARSATDRHAAILGWGLS